MGQPPLAPWGERSHTTLGGIREARKEFKRRGSKIFREWQDQALYYAITQSTRKYERPIGLRYLIKYDQRTRAIFSNTKGPSRSQFDEALNRLEGKGFIKKTPEGIVVTPKRPDWIPRNEKGIDLGLREQQAWKTIIDYLGRHGGDKLSDEEAEVIGQAFASKIAQKAYHDAIKRIKQGDAISTEWFNGTLERTAFGVIKSHKGLSLEPTVTPLQVLHLDEGWEKQARRLAKIAEKLKGGD